jgi:serine/threonine-protein kinase
LYLRSAGSLEAKLVVPFGATAPFFSPDSKWLGFFIGNAIHKVPVGGGQPQRVSDAPRLRGASWGDDGTIVFSAGAVLLRVSANGGEPVAITTAAPGERHYWPHVLPGSGSVLFTRHRGIRDRWRSIAVVSVKNGEIRTFEPLTGSSPRYLPSGHLVFSRDGTIYGVGFDPGRLEVSGEPREILDDVYFYGGSGYSGFDVSTSGALVYIAGADRLEQADLVWLDRQGNVLEKGEGSAPFRHARLSPDGRRVAVTVARTLEEADVFVRDVAGGFPTRLTFDMATLGGHPVWSADGNWIVFTSFQSGHGKLYRVPADGGTPEPLTSGVLWDYAGGVS